MSSFKDKMAAFKLNRTNKCVKMSVCTQKKRSDEINQMLMNLDWLNDEQMCAIMKEYNMGYIKSKECGEDEEYHIGIICDILEEVKEEERIMGLN